MLNRTRWRVSSLTSIVSRFMLSSAGKYFRFIASLKVAMPLLVLTVMVTIASSLQSDTDYYRTWWYLGLLGLNGLSLLFITILHIPSIMKKKGRNALIGVITTHLGILVLIAGIIYGGYTGFRYETRLIAGQATVLPGLPFVIQLDELLVEEYSQEDFPHMNLAELPKKQQDSHITLLRNGQPFLSTMVAPGSPASVDGITLLPSLTDVGWYFELLVIDPLGREKTIPVRPWSPPLIRLGNKEVMSHGVMSGDAPQVDIITMEGDAVTSLGTVMEGRSLTLDGYEVSLGPVKRYTGMQVYNRPQETILVLGSLLMFAGLVWHFYFRHLDRKREGKADA